MRASRQNAHHRHAYRDAERHLRQDHRLRAVRHRRIDFHAAVHRTRVHDDRIRLGQRQALRRQAVALEVFLRRRQQRAAHALVLQAQHDDHVDVLQAFVHVGEDPHAHLFQAARQQRVRADRAHFRHAQRGQRVDVRARHAAVQDVADDGHRQVGEILLVVADRVHVEQALGRVRVAAVAGVDHVDVRSGWCRSGAWRSGRARRTAHGAPRTCRHAWPPGCRWCRAATRPCWPTRPRCSG